jgi:hypothetical protein
MGFDINLESERGEILATVSDPTNLLHRVLERAMVEEPHLEEIDWYGDTTFNRLQMSRFLAQWQVVVRQAKTPEQLKLVNEVRELAERCQSELHLYLKFIGD